MSPTIISSFIISSPRGEAASSRHCLSLTRRARAGLLRLRLRLPPVSPVSCRHAHLQGGKWWYICKGRCYEAHVKRGEVLFYGTGWYHETQHAGPR